MNRQRLGDACEWAGWQESARTCVAIDHIANPTHPEHAVNVSSKPVCRATTIKQSSDRFTTRAKRAVVHLFVLNCS